MSTNKVYGDVPNELPLVEQRDAVRLCRPRGLRGHRRDLPGRSLHAQPLRRQQAGRRRDDPGVRPLLRHEDGRLPRRLPDRPVPQRACSCTGSWPTWSGSRSRGETYTIIGYKGKQVRDQIHSEDVVRAFEAFYRNPRPGEVYNLGGGRGNAASLLELLDRIGQLAGRPISTTYDPTPRVGDHIFYITKLAKFRAHYPGWDLTRTLDDIVEDVFKVAKQTL